MEIIITGRKVNLKDNFKDLAKKKLSKFDRMFNDNAVANVTVTVEKNHQTVEITIRNDGMIYRAESSEREMNEALDKVIYALSRQLRKHKAKLEKRLRDNSIEKYFPAEKDEEEEIFDLVRRKSFTVKPISVEEAILQMNMINHLFYMFRNETTNEINVVYRRRDGGYGLLEPENI